MSISNALSYPFRNNNMLKILPIAIVYSIILYIIVYSAIEENIALMCGAFIAVFAFGLMIGGYYVSAIRNLQADNDNLPEIDFKRNLTDGLWLVLAGIVYFLPLIIVIVILAVVTGGAGAASDSAGFGLLLLCGGGLAAFGIAITLGTALQVGIVRFAAEETSGALFDIGTNWNLVTSNIGVAFGFWWRLIVMGILGAIIGGVVGGIFGMFFPQPNSPFFEPNFSFWLFYAIYNVVIYTVSLLFALAQQHLTYEFGVALGIGVSAEKQKNDPYDF